MMRACGSVVETRGPAWRWLSLPPRCGDGPLRVAPAARFRRWPLAARSLARLGRRARPLGFRLARCRDLGVLGKPLAPAARPLARCPLLGGLQPLRLDAGLSTTSAFSSAPGRALAPAAPRALARRANEAEPAAARSRMPSCARPIRSVCLLGVQPHNHTLRSARRRSV